MTGFRRAVVVLVIVFIRAAPCYSEGTPRVLFTLTSSSTYPVLEDIVSELTVLSLSEQGFDVVSPPDEAETPSPDAPAEVFAGMAGKYGADFFLCSGYGIDSEDIVFDFTWYDAGAGTVTLRREVSGRIDLSLDMFLTDAIREILDAEQARIKEVRAAAPETAEPAEKEIEELVVADQPVKNGPSKVEPEKTEPVKAEPKAIEPAPANSLDLSAGFSAFLVVGVASKYATIGYNPLLSIMYGVRLSRIDSLNVGFESGINFLKMDGLSLEANGMIVPLGVKIGYLHAVSTSVELFTGLSGGPAFFILTPGPDAAENLGWTYKMKLISFIAADAGVAFHFGESFGLDVEIGYALYFEGSMTVMGIAPAAKLYVRL